MYTSLPLSLSLLASLQKERGVALRAQATGSFETGASFEIQSTVTAEAFEKIQRDLSSFHSLMPRRFFDAMDLRNDASFRASQSLDLLAEWYVFNLEQPVHQLALFQLVENPDFSPARTSALAHYLASIAALCHLRDAGLNVYVRAGITPHDINRMKTAAAACLARERLFWGLSNENTKKFVEEARLGSSSSPDDLSDILRRIRSGLAKGLLAETPLSVWIERLDGEVETRHAILRKMLARQDAHGAELAQLNAPGTVLDGDVEAAIGIIETLPLFRGLSENALRAVLKGARFVDLEKNASLMAQGDPVSRFFVVMDGWIKLFKTNADGEESVLQILGRKESVLDGTLFGPGLASVGARAVSRARLLSLALPVLREGVSRNHELAQNLLAATTARLGRLVAHFEQITLRDAVQRVGWFLANLHLETGLEGAPLKLPYDKTLIAAYLNIKPETFSRALQHFRRQGFKIDKHEVVLPHARALCDYCDPDMALRCCRAEAANCAPVRAARRAEER